MEKWAIETKIKMKIINKLTRNLNNSTAALSKNGSNIWSVSNILTISS